MRRLPIFPGDATSVSTFDSVAFQVTPGPSGSGPKLTALVEGFPDGMPINACTSVVVVEVLVLVEVLVEVEVEVLVEVDVEVVASDVEVLVDDVLVLVDVEELVDVDVEVVPPQRQHCGQARVASRATSRRSAARMGA